MKFNCSSALALLLCAASVLTLTEAQKPNFIVMQPDDLRFFEAWTPPPHYPTRAQVENFPCDNCLPNIERLRTNGLQMMEAYTASAMCGTSRFSTITGRYPSRSAYSRDVNSNQDITNVVIPNTKLQDVSVADGNDCSDNNMAALLQKNGYRTGVVGKWHLRRSTGNYDAAAFQEEIKLCGFDFVASIYAENLQGRWHDGTFSHNMEYMTAKGIEFIQEDKSVPFFLYFNPTAPHSSGNVLEALTSFPCTSTPDGQLSEEPQIKGMTEGTTCEAYRQTVIDRANGLTTNNDLGSIWVDDAVGALMQALVDTNQLENTFFLFQMDHGQEGKSSMWEPGVRLAQFIHYPNHLRAGTTFDGMVSTVDIGPTILDFAGINENSPGHYPMDGKSWRAAVAENSDTAATWDDDRCLFFELDEDRAVRCGCYKYMSLASGSSTLTNGIRRGLDVDATTGEMLYNLCNADGSYKLETNAETNDIKASESTKLEELRSFNDCHLNRVKADQVPDYSNCGYEPEPTGFFVPCFSGESKVEVKGKGSIKMSSLQLGDKVLVDGAGTQYEPVYSFGHRQDSLMAEYLQLLPSKIEISQDHMIFIRGKGAIPGSMVEVGDITSTGEAISAIKTVNRRGVYAPFTASGTIVVNGIKASSFVAFQGSETLMVGTWKVPLLTWQRLARAFEAPHRLMCRHMMDCETIELYTLTGVSTWVAYPLAFTEWLLDQHGLVLSFVLLPMVGFLIIVSLVESLVSSPILFFVAVLTAVLFRQATKNSKALDLTSTVGRV